ncbi:chitobiase/beta-hexosaminidase C-terminal domain-containing protein, partial [Odoribacter sp. OttesenSCG-928-L07]|nr:chitobiase/beta-hexosaminidase C-terminal domain-containing protein [Odoribacter sp. OttesenSCG-928-L07]
AEYMLWPRLAALSEVAWSQKEKKDWYRFREKVEGTKQRLGYLGYNYCDGNFKPTINTINEGNHHLVTIESDVLGTEVYYTTDGSNPTDKSKKYTQPFKVENFTIIKAQTYYNGEPRESVASTSVSSSNLTGKNITLTPKPNEKYAANYEYTLADGILASTTHTDGRWLGFQTDKVEIVIENEYDKINEVVFYNNVCQASWVFEPIRIELYTSDNGKDFTLISFKENAVIKNDNIYNAETTFKFDEVIKPRFIKISLIGLDALPEWHEYSGQPWIFIDEVILK